MAKEERERGGAGGEVEVTWPSFFLLSFLFFFFFFLHFFESNFSFIHSSTLHLSLFSFSPPFHRTQNKKQKEKKNKNIGKPSVLPYFCTQTTSKTLQNNLRIIPRASTSFTSHFILLHNTSFSFLFFLAPLLSVSFCLLLSPSFFLFLTFFLTFFFPSFSTNFHLLFFWLPFFFFFCFFYFFLLSQSILPQLVEDVVSFERSLFTGWPQDIARHSHGKSKDTPSLDIQCKSSSLSSFILLSFILSFILFLFIHSFSFSFILSFDLSSSIFLFLAFSFFWHLSVSFKKETPRGPWTLLWAVSYSCDHAHESLLPGCLERHVPLPSVRHILVDSCGVLPRPPRLHSLRRGLSTQHHDCHAHLCGVH